MLCTLLYIAVKLPQVAAQPEAGAQAPCAVTVEVRTVRGASLEPLLRTGDTIQLLRGYYGCHPVACGDVVAYQHPGRAAPIIKVVRGLAGDTLALRPTEEGTGWHLVVNGEQLTTAGGIPYVLDGRRAEMLAGYIRDYHGVIPSQACLLLGNLPRGSLDSTRFGLVSQRELLGKVEFRGDVASSGSREFRGGRLWLRNGQVAANLSGEEIVDLGMSGNR